MTYRQLLDRLSRLSEERLDDNVTIYDSLNDEFMDDVRVKTADEKNDVLDCGHLYLEVG